MILRRLIVMAACSWMFLCHSENAVAAAPVIAPKVIAEYPLPGAKETHELVALNEGKTILISQISRSSIVKVTLDKNAVPQSAANFTIGNVHDGLHGLRASQYYPGKAWATLQFASKLLLLDPKCESPDESPVVIKEIEVPAPGRGPHVIVEYGEELWVSLKDSNHILRINHTKPNDYSLYRAVRKPIFVARHRHNGLVYASQDQSSQILSIHPNSGRRKQLNIPLERGTTPVGLITGPDGNVWFTLAGAKGGTGTFGKINKDSSITWFKLNSSQGSTAGLLHLAFEKPQTGKLPRLHLLASSIADASSPDGVFSLTLNNDYSEILTQMSFIFPTQASKVHRVIVESDILFVTELATSALARIPLTLFHQKAIDEDSDPYSMFGLGTRAERIEYRGR